MKEKTLWSLLSMISIILNVLLIFALHEGTMLFLTIPIMLAFLYAAKTEE